VVTEGKVRLEDATRPLRSSADASGSATPQGADAPVFLTAGAIARADETGLLVQRKSVAEAETHLSWRNGVLMFRELTLADAVAEFNRYNVRKIVIADPAVGALKVEGNFRATNIEAFVRLLESGFAVRASVEKDGIVLRSR
jgi:transmembrane sensor